MTTKHDEALRGAMKDYRNGAGSRSLNDLFNAILLTAARHPKVQAGVLRAYKDFLGENITNSQLAFELGIRFNKDADAIERGKITLEVGE